VDKEYFADNRELSVPPLFLRSRKLNAATNTAVVYYSCEKQALPMLRAACQDGLPPGLALSSHGTFFFPTPARLSLADIRGVHCLLNRHITLEDTPVLPARAAMASRLPRPARSAQRRWASRN